MPLRTIASFREAYAAHIAKARLEAEGIPAFVTDEHMVSVQPLYSDAIGGVKLRVPSEYAERARSIVNEDRSGDLRGVARRRRGRLRVRRCPECGSRFVTRTTVCRRPRAQKRASYPVMVWVTCDACEECGASW